MMFVKKLLQRILRFMNVFILKKELPNKIAIYFHDLKQKEIDDLESILLFFIERDYKFVNLNQLNKKLESNEKLISLTFDDGFSSWSDSIPIFDKYDVNATFFINTIIFTSESKEKFLQNINFIEKKQLMNKNDLKNILQGGHEVGAHTHEHHTLSDMNLEDFKKDISKNIELLVELGVTPKTFAIPFGMRRYVTSEQIEYLNQNFECIAYGEPGMLFKQKQGCIQRYPWRSEKSFKYNIDNISTDTSFFNNLTKRSGLG
jgi:peptidoglycan/xylan/chitin deacetylase (PgdA/CDA1 family)